MDNSKNLNLLRFSGAVCSTNSTYNLNGRSINEDIYQAISCPSKFTQNNNNASLIK